MKRVTWSKRSVWQKDMPISKIELVYDHWPLKELEDIWITKEDWVVCKFADSKITHVAVLQVSLCYIFAVAYAQFRKIVIKQYIMYKSLIMNILTDSK